MSLSRREFLQIMGIAAASGMALNTKSLLAQPTDAKIYDIPKYGNVHFLHFTDCHAQLKPIYFREPTVNLGVGDALGRPPHLVGEHLLKYVGVKPHTPRAHAFSALDFEEAALKYGKVGGFSHLATLIKKMKANRPDALLLDGGDTWQGSATALWTKGQDMVDACIELGVDVMTAHWEMTLGDKRVKEVIEKDFKGNIDFVAQNVKTLDFEDPVFDPYVMKEMNGVLVAIIGQAFPYTPIAHPRHFVANWSFGIQEENMQIMVDEARGKGAKVVVVLSHNGMDVDIKMASRVRGIDAIMGGHTHDGVPIPIIVDNPAGKTIVTNAGSNSKFLGVLDFDVVKGNVQGFKYSLLPVFSNFLAPDAEMDMLITKIREPFESKLNEKLGITEDTLYRRGNFNGTFDQVIVDALMDVKDAEMAFSPGFRWGTSLLPNTEILMENLMDQTATTYSHSTLTEMKGSQIKAIMEDVADNLFNPDPYYQQGGDMVRVGGMQYAIEPNAQMGSRIQDMRLNGKLIDANRLYKVAGWAPVAEGVSGEPVWDVVAKWIKDKKTIPTIKPNVPRIIGMDNNPGLMS
jgi:S-sulfosulfanyl-L-cysteine sulfohydrolase